MPFVWNNWSTNITSGSPISASSLEELRNNIDYCDDNTGCNSNFSVQHSIFDQSRYVPHFSGHDGTKDTTIYTGNFATHDSAKDSTFNATHLVTYQSGVETSVQGSNYSTKQSAPYYAGNDAGKYTDCSSNYTSHYNGNYPSYIATPYCQSQWDPNWNGHYSGQKSFYNPCGDAV